MANQVATASDQGYRVLKRTNQNQVLIVAPQLDRNSFGNLGNQLEKLANLREKGYIN